MYNHRLVLVIFSDARGINQFKGIQTHHAVLVFRWRLICAAFSASLINKSGQKWHLCNCVCVCVNQFRVVEIVPGGGWTSPSLQSLPGAEMTSCQTSRATQTLNDASLVQTARKTAATHIAPTPGQGTLCRIENWMLLLMLESKHPFKILQTWMTQWQSALSCSMHAFIVIAIVVPQACIQHQLCLLYCESARRKTGESSSS